MSEEPAHILARLLAWDSHTAVRGHLDGLLDSGVGVRDLCVDHLTPALHEVGRMWQSGSISVAQEHLATASAMVELDRLAPRLRREPPVGRIALLAATPAELHVVGLMMLRHFLEGDGWQVVDLGQATPADDLARLAERLRPDVVALSTALTTHLGGAREALEALSRLMPRPFVIAGGFAYAGDDTLADDLGADAHASDAAAASELLRRRFGGG